MLALDQASCASVQGGHPPGTQTGAFPAELSNVTGCPQSTPARQPGEAAELLGFEAKPSIGAFPCLASSMGLPMGPLPGSTRPWAQARPKRPPWDWLL